jgi:hypothetical protein
MENKQIQKFIWVCGFAGSHLAVRSVGLEVAGLFLFLSGGRREPPPAIYCPEGIE